MIDKLKGTGVALITPFKQDYSIDYESLERIIEYVLYNRVDYLVVMGTTAETPTLNSDEKYELAAFIRETVKDRVPLVYGIGGNNTSEVLTSIQKADLHRYDAILSVTPYYNKPQQEGLYKHFMAIAEASPLPVILYNVPGRTGVNMTAETTVSLARANSKFCAVKEASGNLEQIAKIIKDKPEDFLVISGDDNLTLPILAIGGSGVISVVANVLPASTSTMVKWGLEEVFNEARKIHLALLELTQMLFANGSPAGIKAALASLGLCEEVLRLPLVPVSPELRLKIKQSLQTLLSTPKNTL
ncbi:MAG TPA: 4-hydroxy-tetrahydrodipicolinate synthase [Bacteroidales bacterium]|jgi:4-hydroxy-tetrahydrodipicolinate synthase|nr:4-hydroxy-tetrahydrodipicolinate synthase [Bacteroidales bacterium]